MAGNANKFEFIMNQDTSDSNDSVKQVANLEKSLHSSLITLAYRKRKKLKSRYFSKRNNQLKHSP